MMYGRPPTSGAGDMVTNLNIAVFVMFAKPGMVT
jgi:hypothetical protein